MDTAIRQGLGSRRQNRSGASVRNYGWCVFGGVGVGVWVWWVVFKNIKGGTAMIRHRTMLTRWWRL